MVYLPSHEKPLVAQSQAAYAKAKTAIAVELANGKPVLPMVMHRIHDGNKTDGGKLLTAEEMVEGQIGPALEAGAAGVVWWGSDGMLVRTVGRDVVGRRTFLRRSPTTRMPCGSGSSAGAPGCLRSLLRP